jgi:hypothetical protein
MLCQLTDTDFAVALARSTDADAKHRRCREAILAGSYRRRTPTPRRAQFAHAAPDNMRLRPSDVILRGASKGR